MVSPEIQYDAPRISLAMWHDRLTDKIDGFRTHEEALTARRYYDAAVSVHLAQKAIEAVRREIQ